MNSSISTSGPLGVFDSGVGGLTVFRELRAALPAPDFLYLGDSARAPYGTRSFEAIYRYTWQGVHYLLEQGCPLIILACNTASARALRSIQQNDLPRHFPDRRVLGIVIPTAEAIDSLTQSKRVGVLATAGTVNSNSYPIEIAKRWPAIRVYQQACPLWVPLVEQQEQDTPGAEYFIRRNTAELLAQDPRIDTLILGCTHYPLLTAQIRAAVGPGPRIVSQGEIVAASLHDYLRRHPEIAARLTTGATSRFLTTDTTAAFTATARVFLGEPIPVTHVELDPHETPEISTAA